MSTHPHPARRRARLAALLVAALLAAATAPLLAGAEEPRQWRWSGVRELVAVGDVHGALDELTSVLRQAGLVDEDLSWIGGAAHLVMLGDLVDRGPDSRAVLDLVKRLQKEAASAGGRVHLVLGNHEVMVLTGDLRYLHPNDLAGFAAEEREEAREAGFRRLLDSGALAGVGRRRARERFDERFPPGFYAFREAFGPEGPYGRWLLDQQILLVINGIAFVHGGLPPSLLDYRADEINARILGDLREFLEIQQRLYEKGVLAPEMGLREQFETVKSGLGRRAKRALPRAERARAREDLSRMEELFESAAFDTEGPLWYRGSSLHPAEDESRLLTRVLAALDADAVVVGHTPSHTGRIETRLGGRVIRVDTGMLASHYDGRPSALVLREGRLGALYPDEGWVPLRPSEEESEPAVFDARAALETFLGDAEVVGREDVGAGGTGAERLVLSRGGERHRAIFKDVETFASPPRETREASGLRTADRYQHEIAAYRLDRMLGLGLVPPTVEREIAGRRGSLQLWVEGAISEANRQAEDLPPRDPAAFRRTLDRMRVFDRLIANPDRDPTNILITPIDGAVHLIDHSRAFGGSPAAAARPDEAGIPVDPELAASLARLDEQRLRRELGDLLEGDQLEALMERRAALLAGSRVPEGAP